VEEEYLPSEKESSTFFDKPSQPEFVWKNLAIGIAVVAIVIFFIYLGVSNSIKASDYKPMDLSTQNQNNGSVAGASTYGPPDKPAGASAVIPTKVAPTAIPQPTATPTSAPNPTATPTPQPTATPTPASTATPTPDNSPTPTSTDTPTPTTTH